MRNIDATRSPMAFFGAELRRARAAAGLSQEQLGQRLCFSGDLVGKVETSQRTPSSDFATRCDGVFPHLDGLFTRLLELARSWNGPHPQWFRDWVEASGARRSRIAQRRRCCGSCWTRPCSTGASARPRSCTSSCCTWPTWPSAPDRHPGRAVHGRGARRLARRLYLAGFNGAPDIVYLETSADGQIAEKPRVVRPASSRSATPRTGPARC
jgi:transcriptional regulator with XRE-family HTH domain